MPSTATSNRVETRTEGGGAVRTELVVDSPIGCPVAQASADTGRLACRVSKSTGPTEDRIVGEFELKDDSAGAGFDVVNCDRVFQTATGNVYQFEEERLAPCACQIIENLDIPLSSVTARDGRLHLTFHADGVDVVRDVVEQLREQFESVTVRHLRHSGRDRREQNTVVDRGRLTDRQLEVLETAHCLGYFEHPREASGTEVAETLDIALSTFAEHLAAAERKILDDVLECDDVLERDEVLDRDDDPDGDDDLDDEADRS